MSPPSHRRSQAAGRSAPSVSLRRLAEPRPARVVVGERGIPVAFEGMPVEAAVEEWVVEDRWWTARPVRRRYFELVLENGRNVAVFRDLVAGGWYVQRG